MEQFTILLNLHAQALTIFGPYLPTVKFFSAVISLLFFTGIVILIFRLNLVGEKAREYSEALSGEAAGKKRTVKVWKEIVANLESGDPARRKYAVIEADKVLDELLKMSGYHGEDMGERLKQITSAQLSNIEDIWQAHKVRNRIAHESDFQVGASDAERIIDAYGRAFRQLKLID